MTTLHGWYYFDIETSSLDPERGKVITVQDQLLYYTPDGKRYDDGSSSKLHILREWDTSEKTILQQVYDTFLSTPEKRHDFTPIGNNLSFEGKFLKYRFIEHGIIKKDDHLHFGRLWSLDLKHILIPINNGYGNYPKLLGKQKDNEKIKDWYDSKQYDRIEKYIIDEAASFVKTTDYLMKKLPELQDDILTLHT